MFGQQTGQQNQFSFGGQNQAQTQQPAGTGFGFGGSTQASNATAGGGLFGSQSQQTGGGTAFGSAPQAHNTGTGGTGTSLFGQPNNATGSSFGGLGQPATGFGAPQPQQQQQQGSTSLFGKPAGQTTGSTGGLFGSTTSQAGAGAQTGAFGSSSTNTSGGGLFGSNKPSLFGQNQNQNQQQTQGTGLSTGLFGSSQPQTQTQTQPQSGLGGGLFGGNKPASTFGSTTGTGGLFGSTQQQQQQQQQQQPQQQSTLGGGLFGSTNSQAQQQQRPGGLFGSSQPQTQHAPPAAPQNVQITPLTRPSDLPEQAQKMLEGIDQYITTQIRISDQLKGDSANQKELIESIPRDVDLLAHKLVTATEALRFDDARLRTVKARSDNLFKDAERCFEVYDTQRPASNGLSKWSERRDERLIPYFKERGEDSASRLEQLAAAVRDVNHGASSLDAYHGRSLFDPNAIPGVLQDEFNYFMALSDHVAELHQNAGRLTQSS